MNLIARAMSAAEGAPGAGLLAAVAEPARTIALVGGAFGLAFVFPRVVPTGPNPATDDWYRALKKPVWQPPSWVFPAVWIPLKILQTAALTLVWKFTEKPLVPTLCYIVHVGLGSLWNYVFFGRRNMKASIGVMATFWVSLIVTAVSYGLAGADVAAYLLIPTGIWVTIAGALNTHTYILNK
ncbi:Tryptophan-rich sensory protein [Porphyridium purpureum]|uniref:Tryptophan-rich sensory protein n=1 Tax=Porphyridium purpureum TaxID=35688 RepID=A0A5J4YZK6_PORPP|nr:Tryptophan-rich sensory protein [Porphyridium purpureum]|eukprot:POR5576..scf208_2